MNVIRRTLIAVAAALLTLPAGAVAQGTGLPSGRSVIDRFIVAIGGRDAIMKQTGRHVKGRFEISAQGLSGDIEVYAAPPNKLSVTVNIPGFGLVRSGYNGDVAWSMNPAMGPMVLDGLQLEQTKHQADFYNALYPPEMITELETVGDTTFEGKAAYKVRVKTTWDEQYFEFYDKQSGLQLGSIRTQASPMGDLETTNVISQWTAVEGVMVPFRSVQRVMGIEQLIIISEMQPTAVPDSVFALPPEIKALGGK